MLTLVGIISAMREIRCGSCGTLNRVRSHSIRQVPHCGKCQVALTEGIGARVMRGLFVWRRYFASLAVLAALLFLFTWIWSASEPTNQQAVECEPQSKPSTGDYFITDFASRIVPFRVETQPGFNYLVKLESTKDKLSSFTFFVDGGQPFETAVPPGTYVLKYVVGKTWCGRTLLFGNKVAERGRTPLVFDKPDFGFEGQTVTLHEVPHRSFETATISKDEF
jgi:hypothetical protein